MANRKTVFVVGAGASKEVGMPTGEDLKATISSKLNFRFADLNPSPISGDSTIYDALAHACAELDNFDINQCIETSHKIAQAITLSPSIDNYINSHNSNLAIETCGKLAIAQSILSAERKSTLFIDETKRDLLNPQKAEKTWLVEFFKLLSEDCTRERIKDRLAGIVFIVFNYDRCIEHFLYNALQVFYGLSSEESIEILSDINIYHPYGSIGSLPWSKPPKISVSFGNNLSSKVLFEISKQIKTFTEGTDPDSSEIKAIRNSIQTADLVLFLGFAYHKQNLELLKPDDNGTKRNDGRYIGTGFGLSDSDIDEIRNDLYELNRVPTEMIILRKDLKCAEIFQEYSRKLSFR